MKLYLKLIFLLIGFQSISLSQNTIEDSVIKRKTFETTYTSTKPKIDGDISDEVWKKAKVYSDFRQNFPNYDVPASQQTEVRVIYDNTSIYIAAKMFDTHPDSIARQLGSRDNDLYADQFRLVIDTYNKQQDAFDFTVYASGVQVDSRFSDGNYNAVWESKVKINEDGWTAEIRIPYSAIRFPVADEHLWGIQFTRKIARNGEFLQWALTPRGVNNPLKYWGKLTGLHHIKAPVRLSLTPFVTGVTSHYPYNTPGQSDFSQRLAGGMDLKYGLNESYTLDISLLPDFTQVQSDNLVKNLGAFKQQYDEQRPFFQENTDLFNKGGLFYSRRIGGLPTRHHDVENNLKAGETIISNPNSTKLLNIAKVSGRSSKGLGVGMLNAVLDNTYATIQDSVGNTRKELVEPFSNYNVTVLDKQLKNSSNVYLINTNVYRAQKYELANTTGIGGQLNNNKNTYYIAGNGVMTNVFDNDTNSNRYKDNYGFLYNLSAGKSSGKFTFNINSAGISPTFNNNNLGITQERNFISNSIDANYNQYLPFKQFVNGGFGGSINHVMNYTTHTFNQMQFSLNGYLTFKNYASVHLDGATSPWGEIDYYEPRVSGRYFHRTKNFYSSVNFSSDYRKKFTYSAYFWGGSTGLVSPTIGNNPFFGFGCGPKMRLSNKLTVAANASYSEDNKDRGWVNFDTNGDIIFGVRYLTNVSYDFNIRYMFKNNLSLTLIGRHYWYRGHYVSFHNLSDKGELLDDTQYAQNHDFNFNTINVNMLFEWQFAPGSFATLSWKNNINSDSQTIINQFDKNFKSTFASSQLNTLSLRVIYFFDVLYLRKKQLVNKI